MQDKLCPSRVRQVYYVPPLGPQIVELYSDLAEAVDQLSADDEKLDDSEEEQREDIKVEA